MFGKVIGSLSVSKLNKAQWISVVKNALIAGGSAFLGVWQQSNYSLSKVVVVAGITAAVAAVVKFIEKAFTPTV